MEISNTTMQSGMPAGCGCPACISSSSDPSPDWLAAPGSNGPSQLLSGAVWTNNGTGLTLKYNFWNALPTYYSGADAEASNFQSFTAGMKTATQEILGMIQSFTNITFVQTTVQADTHLGFAQASLDPQAGAWAYYPTTNPKGGDVWTNNFYASATQNVTKGGYGFFTLMHEIGHALGLQHTFSGGLTGAQNTEQYSVMAYEWDTWGATFAQSFMLYDIYALQNLYGANTNYNTGNNVYVLQSGKAYAIWDAGGIDTLDGTTISTVMTINLDAGTFSSVGLTDNVAIAYGVTIENANGGSNHDTIYGNSVNNVIDGKGGNDTIYASQGNDTLNGGTGTDTVIYSSAIANFLFNFIDTVTVEVRDTVGSFGIDTLFNVENFSFGGIVYDRAGLEASGLNGTLALINTSMSWSGKSAKIASNTAGESTYTAQGLGYAGKTGDLITVDRTSTSLSLDILQNIVLTAMKITGTGADETLQLSGLGTINATILGGLGNDTISITGIAGNDRLYGGDGNDSVTADVGNDMLYGEAGNDVLSAGIGDDRLYGGLGDDEAHGGDGNDYLYGEAGDDELFADAGNDRVYGGLGNDVVDGGANDDAVYGDDGNDTVSGGDGNDRVYGGNGDDTVNAGAGNDRVYGDAGNDIINGDAGDDLMYGAAGNDTMNGGEGADRLYGDAGADVMDGGDGNDTVSGLADNDTVRGGAGDDKVYGGSGNDTVIGGSGTNLLVGESGVDTFGFTELDGLVDTISDFVLKGTGKEYINITDILSGFTIGVSDIDDFMSINIISTGRTDIYINVDGVGTDWTVLAAVKGSNFVGTTVEMMMASGQIITNQSIL